jgi:hypothetical protein
VPDSVPNWCRATLGVSDRCIVARTFRLAEAREALHCLIEDRPFGRVVLTI